MATSARSGPGRCPGNMRVCFLLQDTGTVYGAERATLDLVAGLKNQGSAEGELLLIEEKRLGMTSSRLQAALRDAELSFTTVAVARPFSPSLVKAIRVHLEEAGIDILHCVGYKADLHGGMAARWGALALPVSTVHGWLFRPDRKERFYGWLNLLALKRFSRVVTLSRFYERMLAGAGIPADKLVRIPSGLHLDVPEDVSRNSDVLTFGMLGRLSEEKNHALFLEAVRAAVDRGLDAQFLLAGEGPLRGAIEAGVSQLRLQQHVRVAGYMDRNTFMERIDVYVICSTIENLPYSVLEAMAWSKPVVATDVGGLPDLVDDGQTGLLVPANDADALAGALVAMGADPERRKRFGRAGRAKGERSFGPEQMVRGHMALYRDLLAAQSP